MALCLWVLALSIGTSDFPRTANKFGIMYSRKRISQNSFLNFIFIFPKSFMIFCRELQDPKRNYQSQIWTKAPKDVIMKNSSHPGFELGTPAQVASILSLDHQISYQRVPHINISSIQNYQGLKSCRSLLAVWEICSCNWDLHMNSFVEILNIWLWWSSVKILTIVVGVLGSNPGWIFFFMLTSLGDQV